MVLAETITAIFVFALGVGALWRAFKEDVFGWPLLATVIFLANMLYSGTIPFSVNGLGQTIPTSANKILLGMNLLFGVLAFLKAAQYATDRLKLRA